jgi:hypothetical protein
VVSILESLLELPTPAWLNQTEPVQHSQCFRWSRAAMGCGVAEIDRHVGGHAEFAGRDISLP